MNEISNIASAVGTYNGLSTSISSEAVVVPLVSGLTITKTADKTSWASGPLTYTITVSNQATEDYETPVVTDIIDSALVSFVTDSVYIDGIQATSEQYSYNVETHTLTVNLSTIVPTNTSTVTFQVTKVA